ncbi:MULTISPECIES: NACHT domain-containing protein [unclassified Micromonospora]|nr:MULTISPECIES: NACHT domain-containing protein [unclassified Micromonospora]
MTDNGRRVDVYKEIRGRNRVVILGGAGAGKSMLLKSSAYRWAKERPQGVRLPILVELHRYNEEGSTLISLAEEALARNGLRGTRSMLERALEGGKISLLLDGLDEVSATRRGRALQEIRSVAETYPASQLIVTCRDAVYDGGLAPTFENPVTIAAFDDAAMRRFLLLWFTHREELKGNVRQQVDRMMADLRSNPSVLRLARSPLLLTIMASLHGMDPGLGPSFLHSRAEFYREAVEHLLRRDFDLGRHEKVAAYKAGPKLLALRRIALHTQGADRPGSDGRTLSETDALQLMKALLTELNMEPMHARPMFEEIVDRSELLIPLDGARLRYEFPHLTLQEYLAAVELGDDPNRLLGFYHGNPARWRETVKLWCAGVNRDCTNVILEIFGIGGDPVLALECLAEARKIDDLVALRIISHFQNRIGTINSESHLVTAALGAVAGDAGPRGKTVFSFLRQTAMDTDEGRSRAAMQALAASRLPAAVKLLARLASHQSSAHEALRSMGEQAVPELVALARAGSLKAIDNIAEVGTPSAALGLCELIWDDSRVAYRAAWRLGALIGSADVEEEIRLSSIDFPRNARRHDWVWEPFGEGYIRNIMGRVAFLIANSPEDIVSEAVPALNARLAMPLASLATANEYKAEYLPFRDRELVHRLKSLIEEAAKKDGKPRPNSFELLHPESAPPATLRRLLFEVSPRYAFPFCLDFLSKAGVTAKTIRLWRALPPQAVVSLASGAFWRGKPKRKIEGDWRRINQNLIDDSVFGGTGIVLLAIAILLPATVGLVRAVLSLFGLWKWGPGYLHILAVLPLILAALVLYASGKSGVIGEFMDKISDPVAAVAVSVALIATTVMGLAAIAGWIPPSITLAAFAIFLGAGILLVAVGLRLSLRLTHVFSAALRASRIQSSSGTSIIGKHRDGGQSLQGSRR